MCNCNCVIVYVCKEQFEVWNSWSRVALWLKSNALLSTYILDIGISEYLNLYSGYLNIWISQLIFWISDSECNFKTECGEHHLWTDIVVKTCCLNPPPWLSKWIFLENWKIGIKIKTLKSKVSFGSHGSNRRQFLID